jgi:hypothetical protein
VFILRGIELRKYEKMGKGKWKIEVAEMNIIWGAESIIVNKMFEFKPKISN